MPSNQRLHLSGAVIKEAVQLWTRKLVARVKRGPLGGSLTPGKPEDTDGRTGALAYIICPARSRNRSASGLSTQAAPGVEDLPLMRQALRQNFRRTL